MQNIYVTSDGIREDGTSGWKILAGKEVVAEFRTKNYEVMRQFSNHFNFYYPTTVKGTQVYLDFPEVELEIASPNNRTNNPQDPSNSYHSVAANPSDIANALHRLAQNHQAEFKSLCEDFYLEAMEEC